VASHGFAKGWDLSLLNYKAAGDAVNCKVNVTCDLMSGGLRGNKRWKCRTPLHTFDLPAFKVLLMNSQLIKRSSGWEPADADTARAAYTTILSEITKRSPSFVVQIHEVTAPTWAEHFGLFVRETFSFYTEALKIMSDTTWLALQIHSTQHNRIQTPVTFSLKTEHAGLVDITAYHFSPAVFDFVWEDNTLDRPWTPWGWDIPILSKDNDDDHFFFNPTTNRVIANRGESLSDIAFYGFEPMRLQRLNFFKVK